MVKKTTKKKAATKKTATAKKTTKKKATTKTAPAKTEEKTDVNVELANKIIGYLKTRASVDKKVLTTLAELEESIRATKDAIVAMATVKVLTSASSEEDDDLDLETEDDELDLESDEEEEEGDELDLDDSEEESEEEESEEYTLDDCIAKGKEVGQACGVKTLKEIATEFKAKKISDLKPSQYYDFIVRCEEELDNEENLSDELDLD